MPQFVAVSRERHAGKRWRRPDNHGFAAADPLIPTFGGELFRLAPIMPVAFVEQSGRRQLMAVLSLSPGRNMFVGPDGRWLGSYVPVFFRSYPFRLLQPDGTDESVLCVDEDSKLIVAGHEAGEDFLDAKGGPSAAVKPIVDLLTEVERSRKTTQVAVSALFEAGVVQPWKITLKTPGGEQVIGGLHRIDEAALNALEDEAFVKLRKAGALPVAYAQILSMGQLGVFDLLARFQTPATQPGIPKLSETIDKMLLETHNQDMVRF